MKHANVQALILTAVMTLGMHNAHAQLNCANPANIGSGDQEWGSVGLAPNEQANACGTAGLGFYSLFNDTGSLNSAFGTNAMFSNTSGASNSSFGANSTYSNTTGANNTAFGASALFSNTTGKGSAAQGVNALYSNTTGIRNLGIGNNALFGNTIGSYNIGLGYEGGYNITTGSNNIEIGTAGSASDNNTIQIGSQGTQTFTTIAGIYGTTLTGSAVYVTATGQLGVLASSERYKTEVAAMGSASGKLLELRPVTFKLKADPRGTVQYGLIAEEVQKVYPELVIHGVDGRVDGVRYEELAPMLLNEMQHERRETAQQIDSVTAQSEKLASTVHSLSDQNAEQAAQIRALKSQVEELTDLKQELRAALRRLQSRSDLVAQR